MQMPFNGKVVIDSRGHPSAILLDIKEYKKILELLEDMEDIRYIKKHKREKRIPFDKFLTELKGVGLV